MQESLTTEANEHVVTLCLRAPVMGRDYWAGIIRSTLKRPRGIDGVETNTASHRVTLAPGGLEEEALWAAVERAEYDVAAVRTEDAQEDISMNDLFEMGRRIFKAQPFSGLIGAELTGLETGKAEISLTIRDELKQQHGYVHGGVLSYMVDNCLTFAGGSTLGDAVTMEYKVNYVRPAIGEKLVARASVLAAGKTQAVCSCQLLCVTDHDETLVATALGTIRRSD
ncbi:PaaI family thioesterase [Aquisalimonas sp.]|uniref:PaaI family thioesterase n=1 Tax=Aquisalimonas sp. TaxID=1872621 RepID=UPI0025C56106|nr:PaaI family thioesterase [Aquisalimonas sp.]